MHRFVDYFNKTVHALFATKPLFLLCKTDSELLKSNPVFDFGSPQIVPMYMLLPAVFRVFLLFPVGDYVTADDAEKFGVAGKAPSLLLGRQFSVYVHYIISFFFIFLSFCRQMLSVSLVLDVWH